MVTSPGHGHSPRAPHPLSRESPAVLSAIAADAMLIGVRGLYELTRFEANCFDEPGSEKPCLRSADPAFRAHPILAGPPRRFCGSSSWPYPPATWPTRPTGAESPGQLNRGENPHALRRNLAYAGEGAVRRRHHEQQTEQMWCLTLATNAIVCRSTEYHGLGVAALRRDGRPVHDEILAHIWPTHHENVTFMAPIPSTSTASWPNSTPTATANDALQRMRSPASRETFRGRGDAGIARCGRPRKTVIPGCFAGPHPTGAGAVRGPTDHESETSLDVNAKLKDLSGS